ncbi:MAG: hypothetical protein IJU07_10275 [Synergistaceae bacterium]|nr:hypothetical protein [Synergistaceae bacterium]
MFWFIPLALKGLAIATATVFATAMISVIIEDIISRPTIRGVMSRKDLKAVLIQAVNRTSNKISFRDLATLRDYELTGTGIADDIHVGNKIYVY